MVARGQPGEVTREEGPTVAGRGVGPTECLVFPMDANLLYQFDGNRPALCEGIEGSFRCEWGPPKRWRVRYLDSFDWRLYRKGLSLRHEAAFSDKGGAEIVLAAIAGPARQSLRVRKVPAFATQLRKSSLRTQLETLLGERRLLVRASLDLSGLEGRILNGDDKTVAHVLIAEGATVGVGQQSPLPLPPLLELRPVKGYRRSLLALQEHIGSLPGIQSQGGSLFEFALDVAGGRAGDNPSAVTLCLESGTDLGPGTATILRSQLKVFQANLEGVKRDWDAEFLHDFRVATRRVRSLLSQFKDVLPASGFKRLRKHLKWVGRVTGPMRDIDVYLSRMATYDQIFPPDVLVGLKPLQEYLLHRREEEHALLVGALRSQRYGRLIAAWQESARTASRVCLGLSVETIAAARILEVYQRILAVGAEIGDRFEPVRLHGLRIECKELRYLLEFFRSLFAPQVLDRLIDELKGLQDVLGEINDLQVQQEDLQRYAKAMVAEDDRQTDTLLNMGRLLGHFETSQVRLFPRFRKRLRSFSRRSVQKALIDGLSKYSGDSS